MSVAEIVRAVDAYPTRLVLVTGGEPMLQESVHELFEKLIGKGYTVLVETGARFLWPKWIRVCIRSWISSAHPAGCRVITITAMSGI